MQLQQFKRLQRDVPLREIGEIFASMIPCVQYQAVPHTAGICSKAPLERAEACMGLHLSGIHRAGTPSLARSRTILHRATRRAFNSATGNDNHHNCKS